MAVAARSLPTRERELKPSVGGEEGGAPRSLPTRERELKHVHADPAGRCDLVAPYTGA